MKTILKLALLITVLLLLQGVSLAFPPCDFEACYEFTTTLIDHPEVILPPMFAKMCLVYGDNIGRVSRCGETDMHMSLFFDSMKRQALGYLEDCFIYAKFHGDNNAVATGIEYCENERVSFRGHATDSDLCNCY